MMAVKDKNVNVRLLIKSRWKICLNWKSGLQATTCPEVFVKWNGQVHFGATMVRTREQS